MLEAAQLFHDLYLNGVHKPTPSTLTQNFAKYEKLFFEIFPYCSELNGSFTTSINGVHKAAPRY